MENNTEQLSVSNNDVPVTDTAEYIEAIKQLKENSVSKDAYLKVKAENKQLLDTLINNGQVTTQEVKKDKVDLNKMRDDLLNHSNHMLNVDYVQKVVDLRNAVMDAGQRDPFLPNKANPTSADIEEANKVGEVLQECLDIADGDNDVFTNEFQRRLVEPIMPKRNPHQRVGR